MTSFYKTTIKEIKRETANAVSLVFNIPKEIDDKFKFTSGQYITLKKEIGEKEVRRAYSICSTPKSGELRVAVKEVENGTFSTYVNRELNVGDTIEITIPEGRFLLNPEAEKNYLAFAAGSGITPIMSMIKNVLKNEPSSTFTLIYGNKSITETIFYNELLDLKKKYSNFNLEFTFSKEEIKGNYYGRVDKGLAKELIANKYAHLNFNKAFLCGPEAMINNLSETLKQISFPPENIYFELFTASEQKAPNVEIENGLSNITILLDDEETSFSMTQADNILAAALRNDLDPPYSCQGGVCSSCLAKVTEGEAVMAKNSILTKEEVDDGYILTCQAHPTTSKIFVDFDDV